MINYSNRNLPAEWGKKKLSQVVHFWDNKRVPIKEGDRQNRQGPYPYYGASGIIDYIDDYIFDEDLILLAEDGANILARSTPIAFKATGKYWVNNHAHILKPKSNADIDYLIFYLESLSYRKYNSGAAQPKLNREVCTTIPVIYPPLPEQKAIADLLSTWDEAIKKTEWLIQTKEMWFKRLLNDLIYLPTKEGKWKQIRTKYLFKERKEAKRGDLPLLSITNGEGVIPREDTNRKDTSNEDKSKYLRICPGDIGYNTMRMWQGVSALSSLEGIVSPAYTICIPGEKLHPLFVAYLFKMPFMIHRFYRYSQGLTSDTWNLKFPHFSEVKMPLPSIAEQEQIAETLSAARREIDLLKQLADKYKTQKRGLMQKILTGEWRIKPDVVKVFEEQ